MPPAFRMKELKRLFPFVAEVEVRWTEEGEGVISVEKGPLQLSEGNLVGHLPCGNPGCSKGGYELTGPLKRMFENREAHQELPLKCMGYLGSRRTSRGAPRCGNTAQTGLAITYRE